MSSTGVAGRDALEARRPALPPGPAPERYADLLARWEPLMALREEASLEVERARQSGAIGNPLEARVEVRIADEARWAALAPFAGLLPVVLKVSQATLTRGDAPGIEVGPAPGAKCARCWLVKADVEGEAALCGRCSAVVAAIEGA